MRRLPLSHRRIAATERNPARQPRNPVAQVREHPVLVGARVLLHLRLERLAVAGALEHQGVERSHARPAGHRALVHDLAALGVVAVRGLVFLGEDLALVRRGALQRGILVQHQLRALVPQVHAIRILLDRLERVHQVPGFTARACDRIVLVERRADADELERAVRRAEILDRLLEPVPALLANRRTLGLLVGNEIVREGQLRALTAVEGAANRLIGAVGLYLHAIEGDELAHLPDIGLSTHLGEIEGQHRVDGELELHHFEQLGRQPQFGTENHDVVDRAGLLSLPADLVAHLALAQQRLHRAPHRRDLRRQRRLGLAARRPPPLAQAPRVAQDLRHAVAEVGLKRRRLAAHMVGEVGVGEELVVAPQHPDAARGNRRPAAVEVQLVRLDLPPRRGDELADLIEELRLVQPHWLNTSLSLRLNGSSMSTHSANRSGCLSRMNAVSSSITS